MVTDDAANVMPPKKPRKVIVHTQRIGDDERAREVLRQAAALLIDEKARRDHPNDLYAQTVDVMGFDPLGP